MKREIVVESNESNVPTLLSMFSLLTLECLFTLVGGYMDAYAFLAHGHVFANAQTGNVVLLAISAAQANWWQAARHAPPILACSMGVATAKLLGTKSSKRTFCATLVCQTIELSAVAALVVLDGSLPDSVIVPSLSFVAALQITSFDRLGPWSFNSAMTTGNLKTATLGIVLWLRGDNRPENGGKAVVAGVACLSFLLGALFGGVYTHRHPTHALFPCSLLLLLGYVLTWREHSKVRRRRCDQSVV